MEADNLGVETLEGNLANINLVDILVMITSGGMVGTLEICSINVVKKIFFREKGVSISSFPPNPQWRLGDLLIEMGKLTPQSLDAALNEQRNSQLLLGQVLLKNNYVAYEDIVHCIRRQIKEELFELFQWVDAEFVFRQGMINQETRQADTRVVDLSFDTSRYMVDLAGVINTLGNIRRDGTLYIRGAENHLDIEFREGILYMGTYGIDANQSFLNYLLALQLITEEEIEQLPQMATAYDSVESLGTIPNLAEAYYEWMASLFLHVISENPCSYSFYSLYPVEIETREPLLSAPLNFREILLGALVKIEKWNLLIDPLPIAKNVLPIRSGKILDVNNIPLEDYFPKIKEILTKSVDYSTIEAFASLSTIEVMVIIIHFVRDGFIGLSEELFELSKLFEISEKAELQQETLLFMMEFYPCEYDIFEGLSRYYNLKHDYPKAAHYLLECSKFQTGEEQLKTLQKVLNMDSANIDAQQLMISYHLSEKRIERALPIAKKVITLLLEEGRNEEAEQVAQYFIDADHDAPAFYSLFVKEYKQKEEKEKLVETLKSLAAYYELRSKYETLFSVYKQILQVDPLNVEIKEKVNALKKQGIGGEGSGRSPLIAVVGVLVLVLLFIGYKFFFSSGPINSTPDDTQQEVLLNEVQLLKEQGNLAEAIKKLKPLLEISVESAIYTQVQELNKELVTSNRELTKSLSNYKKAKAEKRFFYAKEELNNAFLITPKLENKMKAEKKELLAQIEERKELYKKSKTKIEGELEQLRLGSILRQNVLDNIIATQKEFEDFLKYNPQDKFFSEQIEFLKLDIGVNEGHFKEKKESGDKFFKEEKYDEALERYKGLKSHANNKETLEIAENLILNCKNTLEKNTKQKELWVKASKAHKKQNAIQAAEAYEEILRIDSNTPIAKIATKKLADIKARESDAVAYVQGVEEEVKKGEVEAAWKKADNLPSRFEKTLAARDLYFPVKIAHPRLTFDVFKEDEFLGKTPYILKLKKRDEAIKINLVLDGYKVTVKGVLRKKPWLLDFEVNKGVRFELNTNSPVECQPCLLNEKLLIASRNGLLQLVEPNKGGRIWSYTISNLGEVLDTPLFYKQKLYFGCTNGQLIVLEASETDYKVISDDTLSRDKFEIQPIVLKDTLIIASQQGSFYGCDLQTGKKKWSKRIPGKVKIRQIASRFIEFGGYAYCSTIDGRMWRISSSGSLKPARKMNGKVVSFTTFGGNLIVATKNYGVHALKENQLSKGDNNSVWKAQLTGETLGTTIFKNKLWVSAEGSLFNFMKNGDTELELDFIQCRTVAEIGNGKIYVATRGGLSSYDMEGRFLWEFKLKKKIFQPLYHDGVVYFGCKDGSFYAIPTN